MKSPYISSVYIKNFRNFKECKFQLNHKQVIVGENSVGKTNYIFALRLILDPNLSDNQRMLSENDFCSEIVNPVKNKEEIVISIEIDNYEHNKNILAQICDATIRDSTGKEKLSLTYKFRPRSDRSNQYEYIIYKGNKEDHFFTYKDREILNIKVINALRDVEKDLKSTSKSPLNIMLKKYEIEMDQLEKIVNEMHQKSEEFVSIDEISDLSEKINKTYNEVLKLDESKPLSFKTTDIDPNKILHSLKLLNDNRTLIDNSLGINNILYISLILSALKDETIPTLVKREKMDVLKSQTESNILEEVYSITQFGNYKLKEGLSEEKLKELYQIMTDNSDTQGGFTILAIEEPEAHLHPINQRLIYDNIINQNDSSVILTTHSTHITSITPIEYMVSLRKNKVGSTEINSACLLKITEGEKLDLERYIDIKKSELYFGKGIIFVEGIAEEFLVPSFANLLGYNLDKFGIFICNINSTNFKPFINLAIQLNIPFTVITDGDFYYINDTNERVYHKLKDEHLDKENGYLGYELLNNQLLELGLIGDIEKQLDAQKVVLNDNGIFLNEYTLEVEIMKKASNDPQALEIISEIYNELTLGGEIKKTNFKNELETKKYNKCLSKIEERGIGKGRFSQILSRKATINHVPNYIENSIEYIVGKVRSV